PAASPAPAVRSPARCRPSAKRRKRASPPRRRPPADATPLAAPREAITHAAAPLQAASPPRKDLPTMADVPAAIADLGDKIANLKLTEAVLLKDYLKERYKIEPAAGGVAMMAGPAAAAAPAEKPPEQT